MRKGTERQQRTTERAERGKKKGWTEAGHFSAHISHNRNQESLGDEIRERQEEGRAGGSPGNKTFSLCVYDACQTNDNDLKHFFGGEDMRCR